jgi:SynChlorMet cassette protein ScmC
LSTYSFTLNDKITIQLIPTKSTINLVNHLAKIFKISISNKKVTFRFFIFFINEFEEKSIFGEQWIVITIRSRIRIRKKENSSDFFFELMVDQKELEYDFNAQIEVIITILGAIWLILSEYILILHGALVVKDHEAFAIVAKSGTGKSTAASRIPYPWVAISDDAIAVVKNEDVGYLAYGLPSWSGLYDKPKPEKYVDINMSYVLKKIYFLEQSKDDSCLPILISDSVNLIIQSSIEIYSTFWYKITFEEIFKIKRNLLMNAKDLSQTVGISRLNVKKDGQFWNCMT